MKSIPFRERLTCTVPEACDATGLGRSKIYEEIGAGRIQTAKIGKRTLIVVSSLLTLVEACTASVPHLAAPRAPSTTLRKIAEAAL
jgi:excisionase family DNA binding protein